MILSGEIMLFGVVRNATLSLNDDKKSGVSRFRNGKWRAYQYDKNNKQQHLGYYSLKSEAVKAAALGVNLSAMARKRTTVAKVKRSTKGSVFLDSKNGVWRVVMPIGGRRVSLGTYGTYGNAVLVRDVVARRAGLAVTVADYEMPLSLVSNPIARSYIRDRVPDISPDEMTEYQRRVAMLNEGLKP